MRKHFKQISFICGLLLTLAAFPVFAQEQAVINRKPLKDFGDFVISKLEKKEVDLTKPFLIELHGSLNKEGKFDNQKTKFIRAEGDTQMTEVAKSGVEAINDSGLLFYLKNLGINKINLIMAQNEEQFYLTINSEQISQAKAQRLVSGLNLVFGLVKFTTKDENVITLFNGAKSSTKDKLAIIEFVYSKTQAQEMIKQKIDKEIAGRKVRDKNSQ